MRNNKKHITKPSIKIGRITENIISSKLKQIYGYTEVGNTMIINFITKP